MISKKLSFLVITLSLLLVVTTIMALSCSSGATTSSATPSKPLKIGILADLSGFLSVFYLEAVNDLQITADYINEKGGVTIKGQKYKVELVVRDSKSSPDGALAAANQLVFQDQVKYAIGPIAFEGGATSPLFEQNKILHIFNSTTTSPQEMGPNTPYAFSGDSNTLDFATCQALIVKKEFPNAKTGVVVFPDDGTPQFVAPKIYAMLKEKGFTTLNNDQAVVYPNDMQDFSPIATKLKTINPDFIIHPAGAPPHTYGILKGIRSLGMSAVYVPTLFPGDPETLIQAVGAEAATNFACLNYRKDNPKYSPILKELISRLKPDAPFFTFTLGNCLMDLTNVMQLANSLDVDAIKSKWESLSTLDSVYGTGKVGGEKTFGLKNHSVTFPEPYELYKNGKVVTDQNTMWVDPGATP